MRAEIKLLTNYPGFAMPICRFSVLLLLLALVCVPYAQAQALLNPQEANAVRNVVMAFYGAAPGGRDYCQLDARLISEELNALLQLVKAIENRSAREVEASEHPTDKPRMLEGSVTTPIYEGYSRVIAIGNPRKTGNTYRVDIKLAYGLEAPVFVWTDTAVLIQEDGRWKVDDILFNQTEEKDIDVGSTKETLRDFAGMCRR
jgi:hypothetical protein